MTPRRQAAALAIGLAATIAYGSTTVRTDDPVSSNVRFTGEIVRIFSRKCEPCHAGDGLAMPLSNYRDVRAWGRAIREEIVEQRMPPASAARGYGRFRNDLSLSARETLTVLSWIDGGMPRGDDKELPAPAAAGEPRKPDLRLALPSQRVPALEDHLVRRVTIPASGLDPARAIARIAIVPGSAGVVRGAFVYAVTPGADPRWIGAWLPWQRDAAPPDGHGFTLRRGAQFSVELHYRGADNEVTDTPFVEVYYAAPNARKVDQLTVGAETARLAAAASVWAIVPSTGSGTASLQVTARRPDGSTDILLWMPKMHHEWPQALVLDAPVKLPAGTTVSLITHPADAGARVRLSLLP